MSQKALIGLGLLAAAGVAWHFHVRSNNERNAQWRSLNSAPAGATGAYGGESKAPASQFTSVAPSKAPMVVK